MSTQNKSLADKAYHTIKHNILNLTYPPGMPLTEAILTEELEMSRNPVRTAIKMLQAEGLIVSDYHKSMTVKEITNKDIEEIYQLREIFEGSAFKLIFSSNRFEEYSYRIEEKVVRMCAVANNPYEWEVADTKMHLEIVSIFDNTRINKFYESNLFELIRMGLYSLKNGMQIEKTNANLKKMVQYIRNNDYKNAYAILTNDHFMTGKDSALSEYQHE
ncbi:GntR family transcriptional regulator [Faecalimonas sp.]